MIIPTTTTITNTATSSRKRSRPLVAKRSLAKSLPLVALAILLVVSQATAFTESLASSESEVLPNTSLDLEKILPSEFEGSEMEEWNEDEEECLDEDDEWEYVSEDEEYDEEYDDEYYEYEEDWSPEEYEVMNRLYESYLKEVARRYGANWEDKFELVIDKEEIYEEYLNYEEKKQQAAEDRRREQQELEDRRQLVRISHKALQQHDQDIRVEEYYENDPLNRTEEQELMASSFGKTMATDLPSRTHMIVLNNVVGYNKNNRNVDIHENKAKRNGQQECHVSTTIVTTQGGNTHTVIASI